jgi:hypothetical protein
MTTPRKKQNEEQSDPESQSQRMIEHVMLFKVFPTIFIFIVFEGTND